MVVDLKNTLKSLDAGPIRSIEMRENSAVSTVLLVLVSSNLFLLFSDLDPSPSNTTKPVSQVEPLSYILSKLSTILMAYLSSISFSSRHRLSLDELVCAVRHTWRRPVITAVCVELFATALASLLLMLRVIVGAADGLFAEAVAVAGSVVLVVCVGPILFAYSDIACKLSLVVAVLEKGHEGLSALERAEEVVKGRRAQGFVLALAMSVVERVLLRWACGDHDHGHDHDHDHDHDHRVSILCGLVFLVVKFIAYYAYTMFYYECKRCHVKVRNFDAWKYLYGL